MELKINNTIKNPNIDDIDEVFYAYIIQHKKQYDHHLNKCHFKTVFNDNQYNTMIKSNLFINKTMIVWKKYLEYVIDDFKVKEYNLTILKKRKLY